MEIRRPKEQDLASILETLTRSITIAFLDEGLISLQDDIENEIVNNYELVCRYIHRDKKEYIFLVALESRKVIGLISYGTVGDVISDNIDKKIKAKELGSIYVHPEYQNRKVASKLIIQMIKTLLDLGINEFVLDCGFSKAQKIWMYKFGQPYKILKNYWPSGSDHYIWHCTNIEKYL